MSFSNRRKCDTMQARFAIRHSQSAICHLQSAMYTLSFIIVSWNVRDLLRRALQSILDDAAAYQFEIIIIDNASTDGTVEMLHSDFTAPTFPNIRVIPNPDNLGFTRANNQGLEIAQGRYLFLLNPDTELQPGATRALLGYMDAPAQASVGIVGPQLTNPDGSVQSSRRRFPTLPTALAEALYPSPPVRTPPLLRAYYMDDTSAADIQDVSWVVGAAMFARRAVYDQIGGLDERFFMYSEEVDWCLRARQAGWRVVYLPLARVTHHEGKSAAQVVARRDIHYHSSKVRYLKKHHGALQSEILRYFTLTLFAYRLAQETAKYVLGHRRPLRAQRITAYRQVLANGLK